MTKTQKRDAGTIGSSDWFDFMKPGQYINVVDDDGIIHTMRISKVREDNRTVTGEIAVWTKKDLHPMLKEITVREYQILYRNVTGRKKCANCGKRTYRYRTFCRACSAINQATVHHEQHGRQD